METKLWTRSEVCDLLKISKPTLFRLVRNKQLKPIYIGALPRFQPIEIERFIENLSQKKAGKNVA